MTPREWAQATFLGMVIAFTAGMYIGMVVTHEHNEFAALDVAQAAQGCDICFTDACLGEVFGNLEEGE